jgi:hypothetical protein
VLYNRRLKSCGFCEAPIPEELRFSPAEIAGLALRFSASFNLLKLGDWLAGFKFPL